MNDVYTRLATLRNVSSRKLGYWQNQLRRIQKIDAGADVDFELVRMEWLDEVQKRVWLLEKQVIRLDALPPKLEASERKTFEVATSGTPTKTARQITLKKGGKSYTRHLRWQNGGWYGRALRSNAIVQYEV